MFAILMADAKDKTFCNGKMSCKACMLEFSLLQVAKLGSVSRKESRKQFAVAQKTLHNHTVVHLKSRTILANCALRVVVKK